MSLRHSFSTRCQFLPLAGLILLLTGCGDSAMMNDPGLKQIHDTLAEQLPPGTPSSLVFQYVTARGYPIEPAGRSDALVVIIRHIDQQRLKPVTARVTFHFDSNDKLTKTEIVRTLNQSPTPAPSPSESQPQPSPENPPQPTQ